MKEVVMLKLAMLPDEYVTINGDIVVLLTRVAGGRAHLAIEANKDVPILRGTVLEREGGQRPACLTSRPKRKRRKYQRDIFYPWNDDKDRAVQVMHQVIDHLAKSGAAGEAKILRTQLARIVPDVWEDEIPMK